MDHSKSNSREKTVSLIGGFIETKTPAAAVRFGEGEGRLLAVNPHDEASVRTARRKLYKQTGLSFPKDEILKVRDLIREAMNGADILGLHADGNFSAEHSEWMEFIGSFYEDRVARTRAAAHIGHCLFHQDLDQALPDLLEGVTRVSVVSCRDVRARLIAEHRLEEVAVYQVPSQFIMRAIDGDYEARLHDVPIWPDFYNHLESTLTVHETGEVFLVGAGLFGKSLCVRIRERGGIALDMGSTLDRLAGKSTRGRRRPPFERTAPPKPVRRRPPSLSRRALASLRRGPRHTVRALIRRLTPARAHLLLRLTRR